MKAWVVILGVLGLAVGVRADDSPFLPLSGPTGAAAGQAADGSSYELRGIMTSGGVTKYCIYDATKKTSVWVGVNEHGAPFLIRAADPVHDTVTLEAGGQPMTLALHAAKVVSVAFGGSLAGPPPGGSFGPVVLKPTPEDEQRRLQAIADEVRRRRQLRERAQAR